MTIIETIPIKSSRNFPSYGETRRGLRRFGTKAGKRDIRLGGKVSNVFPGDDLQKIINSLDNAGGGTLFFSRGTYIIGTALSGKSAIQFVGENTSTTILDFNSTAANLAFAGTSAYAVGTITSIVGGVTVTGSGTSWLANVTTDHQFFIAQRWYKIAAVTSDTELVLAEGYQGGATFPGAAYRAVKVIKDIEVRDLTLKNSTGTALDFDDVRNVFLEDCEIIDNNKGFTMDNCAEVDVSGLIIPSNTSNGCEFNTCGLVNVNGLATPSNGGHGVVMSSVRTGSFIASSSDSNTSDGVNITGSSDVLLIYSVNANGGQGIELVSGNTGILIQSSNVGSNTGDGIKLTATSDDTIISNSQINSNGAYGVNVAASTDDNNLIIGNKFAGNVTAAYTDSGTGTLIRSNIGATDN